jgi:hypothetical protein
MKLFCSPGLFHTWKQWVASEPVEVYTRKSIGGVPVEGSERIVGFTITQTRKCLMCGYTQVDIQKKLVN